MTGYYEAEAALDDADGQLENCERCGHLMPEDCIGWCAECDSAGKQADLEHEDCICWWSEDSHTRSVCGLSCPVHGQEEHDSTPRDRR